MAMLPALATARMERAPDDSVAHDFRKMTSPGSTPDRTGTAMSADGTAIGYYSLGQGRGLVLVHGAAQTAESFRALATDLSSSFTVYVPDRRGRGRSASYGNFEGLRTEVADLGAVLDATEAHYVFGLSSGAVVALESALVRPEISKLALYEPPLSFDGVRHGEWVPRYERELALGDLGGALATVLKATSDRTAFRLIPRPVLSRLFNSAIRRTANRPAPPGSFSPRELIPTIHYDAQVVAEAAGPLERFAALRCETLLIGGSKSYRNLGASLDGLGRVLPDARRVTIRGVGHIAADNDNQPLRVAAELRRFFA
jgi:pimeloyl-ACP methyl ester carboxylesterase